MIRRIAATLATTIFSFTMLIGLAAPAQAHAIVTTTGKSCSGLGNMYGSTWWGHVYGTLRDVDQVKAYHQTDAGKNFNYKITKHDSNGVMQQWTGYSSGDLILLPGPVRVGGPYTPRFDFEYDLPGDGQTVWCRLPTHYMPSSQ